MTFQKSVQDFSLSEMNKKDSYIIKYDRSVSPEKRQAIIQDFVRMIKDNGGAVVQEKGFEYDRFATNFQPSDLSTVESITRSRIATAFNVPISFLSESEASHSNKTAEQVMTQFVEMTLLPIVKQYEAEFNRKLLTPEQRARGIYFKFNVNGLLRGDTASRTNFYQMMIRNGIASINDLRKLEELPPSDAKNADQLWLSGDLYPIDSDQIGKGRADTGNPLKGVKTKMNKLPKYLTIKQQVGSKEADLFIDGEIVSDELYDNDTSAAGFEIYLNNSVTLRRLICISTARAVQCLKESQFTTC